ncbi:DUF3090 family protein [Acidimicrobiaceae bacterium USS-CC1]|uniref:DUF3090 family protein n=1 Tax=Acidiferrimicrobium australe TaxID=2664430 RepID=A0ABW9QNH9_9ACTN|nr:DUF3090 family protein [Acidiferrimicrobium australe]
MSESFELADADRLTVGTVGPPGHRVFYLQAGEAGRTITLKVEKQQVAVLSQAIAELLADLRAPEAIAAAGELLEPVDPLWAVGGMQIAYDQDDDRLILVAQELLAEEDADEDDAAVGRLRFTREQAAALVARGEELVEAGRPPCPWCGYPLDPAGHSCPRTNGHRPPTP